MDAFRVPRAWRISAQGGRNCPYLRNHLGLDYALVLLVFFHQLSEYLPICDMSVPGS